MAWQVGIDEAGYGPNLGPFVMTAVAVEVPERLAEADLWQVLDTAVRRASDPEDDRLLVADSKQIHVGKRGLDRLEANTLPFVLLLDRGLRLPLRLASLWNSCGLTDAAEWTECPWADPELHLPLVLGPSDARCSAQRDRLQAALQKQGITCLTCRWVVAFPEQFNRLTRTHGSKAAVSQWAFSLLLRNLSAVVGEKPRRLVLHADKQGGRHYYGGLLQQALPGWFVLTAEEAPESASYRLVRGPCRWQATFRPRAESDSFAVALASMLSKYLREAFMHEFNRFWLARLPALRPTAGYPQDAVRFLAAIEPVRRQLRIPLQTLWRER